MACTALQSALRILCWRRNSKEVGRLLISIRGLWRRSESGASHPDSLQRSMQLEKTLLFALENLTAKRRKEGDQRKEGNL